MHRKTIAPVLALVAIGCVSIAHAELKLPRTSPKASVMQTIGMTDVTVTYSRPGVKGRTIFGGLESWDKPWRTGANEATTVTVSQDVTIGGNKLPAGTYSFFTIPKQSGPWTAVFSKQKDLWGAYEYKPEEDALRIDVAPTTVEPQEWLRFSFENLKPGAGDLVMRWDKTQLVVPIQTDDLDEAMASINAEIAAKPKDAETYRRSADFAFNNTTDIAQAEKWAKQSVTLEPGYFNQNLLARIQAKQGKKAEAIATGKKAIATGKASKDKPDTTPTAKLVAEWEGKGAVTSTP
jgi:hypothetical protein